MANALSISERAKSIYESRLRETLESSERGRFVAIEPDSGDYFLGDSFDDAVNSALDRYPERITFTIRIGSRAAIHLGVLSQ